LIHITLKQDLDFILNNTIRSLLQLKHSSLFITGATGFFGKWLLQTLQWANQQADCDIKITALSRNPAAFIKAYPDLAKDIAFIQGDISNFAFPKQHFDYIIHAATEASAKLNNENPALMLNTIVAGTQRILAFSKVCGAKRILHTSSGAVYGVQPTKIDNVSEDYCGAPDIGNIKSAYGEGKRIAELLSVIHAQETGIELINARCFAFVGLYLPLTTHFAIGNFIHNGLTNQPILINGDGTARRSYLYAADLMVWLLTLLTEGKNKHAYNVGSDISYSIAEIATAVQTFFPHLPVKILQQPVINQLPERYIPSIEKAKNELGLKVTVDLNQAIEKTIVQNRNFMP